MNIIYEPKGAAREYADLALNIFSGCDHGCTYCYGPATLRTTRDCFMHVRHRVPHRFLDGVRKDAAVLAERGETAYIHLCFTCDPYCHFGDAETDAKPTTREVLEILLGAGLNVQILTKGGIRAMRDMDLLQQHKDQVRFGVTLTFDNELDRKRWEPFAAPTWLRMKALEHAHKLGIPTWVSIEPVIDPEQSLKLIGLAAPYTDEFRIGKLNHHPEIEKKINWRRFAAAAGRVCEHHGVPYLIKNDLLTEIGGW
jgi:DNA repair photolyase